MPEWVHFPSFRWVQSPNPGRQRRPSGYSSCPRPPVGTIPAQRRVQFRPTWWVQFTPSSAYSLQPPVSSSLPPQYVQCQSPVDTHPPTGGHSSHPPAVRVPKTPVGAFPTPTAVTFPTPAAGTVPTTTTGGLYYNKPCYIKGKITLKHHLICSGSSDSTECIYLARAIH